MHSFQLQKNRYLISMLYTLESIKHACILSSFSLSSIKHARALASIKHALTHGQRTLSIPHSVSPGSAITNGREPRSCLGRVFNSQLGCIPTPGSKCMVCMQPLLKLKTRPKACPVSLSLSMVSQSVSMLDYYINSVRNNHHGDIQQYDTA